MNIFILDIDPSQNAQALCDKHVVKMVLETAQLLCGPFNPGCAPYKRTHYNHPCAIWTRQSKQNYEWLLEYGEELLLEYTFRYGKTHACTSTIAFCRANYSSLTLSDIGLTPFAQAMPDQYKQADPVCAYRAYYKGAKSSIAKWNKARLLPPWYNQSV